MNSHSKSFLRFKLLALVVIASAALSMACGSGATPAIQPSATPKPLAAPTVAPRATAAPAPTAAPTATVATVTKPAYGGVLRAAEPLTMNTLNPHLGADFREQIMFLAIFDSLVEVDENYKVIRGLAESWDISSDGLSITFHMQKGLKFQDGSNLDAQAVKWNIEKMADPSYGARLLSTVSASLNKVEAPDSNTLVVRMKKPYRPLLGNMTLAWFRMMSPTAWEKFGKDVAYNPVGSGAFKFKEWVPGDHITLERFDGNWEQGRPYLDGVKFTNASDPTVQLAMLRTGEVDFVRDVAASNLPLVNRNPSLQVAPLDSGYWWGLIMDVTLAPWNNKPLRQAIAYALDRQTIVQTYLDGHGRPDYTIGVKWYEDPKYKPYDYDPQKAKEKLAEAGYSKGITFEYWCNAQADELKLCEIVQATLANVGISTKLVMIAPSDYWANWLKPVHIQRFGLYRYIPRPDPDFVLYQMLHCDGSVARAVSYCNREASAIVEQAAATYDPAVAGPLYIKAQEIVFGQDVPYASMFNHITYGAMNKRVKNFSWIPDTFPRFKNVWLEK